VYSTWALAVVTCARLGLASACVCPDRPRFRPAPSVRSVTGHCHWDRPGPPVVQKRRLVDDGTYSQHIVRRNVSSSFPNYRVRRLHTFNMSVKKLNALMCT
jgi:hypothetical protein